MNYVVTIQQQVSVQAKDSESAKEIAEKSPPFRWMFGREGILKTLPVVKVVGVEEE